MRKIHRQLPALGRCRPAGLGKAVGSQKVSKTSKGRKRVRLDPDARAAMILEEAVAYFAEHGLEAQVRELSERLCVSQGLIYRYFGTKQNLVERVYEQVYEARWSEKWERILRDRSRPLAERLVAFYKSYLEAVGQYEWIRVSLFSGLAGYDLTRRYVMTRVDSLLQIIMRELQCIGTSAALPSQTEALYEVVWHLHSTFIYYLVRKHVFRIPVMEDRDAFIEAVIASFMSGFRPDHDAAVQSSRPSSSPDERSVRKRTTSRLRLP